MVHIILTGATGTAGAAVLARCIASSTITRVSVLSRRPVKQAAGVDKVNVFMHNDFNTYPESLLGQLKGAVGCVWALGIASGQVGARCVARRIIPCSYLESVTRRCVMASGERR